MRPLPRTALLASALGLALASAGRAEASPGLDDYRRFRALTVDLFRSDEEELQEYLDEHFPPSNRTPKSNGKGRLSGKFHP